MAARKRAAAKQAEVVNEPVVPQPNAATREADKLEEKAPTFRVDLGQGLPTPPIKTATDKK